MQRSATKTKSLNGSENGAAHAILCPRRLFDAADRRNDRPAPAARYGGGPGALRARSPAIRTCAGPTPTSCAARKTWPSACASSASKRAIGSASGPPNVSEWVLAQFGTALAGLILVNINPAYRSHEFDYAIKKSGCRALILSRWPQEQRLFRLAPDLRARNRRGRAGQAPVPGPAEARVRHPPRRGQVAGHAQFR